VASPQGRPPQVLGVHPGRRREAAQREHRGRAPGDPSGHGGADAGGGDQAHPVFVVRRPQVEAGDDQGRGGRRRQWDPRHGGGDQESAEPFRRHCVKVPAEAILESSSLALFHSAPTQLGG